MKTFCVELNLNTAITVQQNLTLKSVELVRFVYISCIILYVSRNVRCGSLQCQLGNRYPVNAGKEQLYATTIISIKGVEYECK